MVQSRVLNPAHGLALAIPVGVDTLAPTTVLGLVELAVYNVLNDNQQNAEEQGECYDANVCRQVPFLEADVLSQESIGLGGEGGRASR